MRARLPQTDGIPNPSFYISALQGEYRDWAFDQDRAELFSGQWRSDVFASERPLDVEIGTGNGFHYAWYARENPQRLLVGLEIKFKPLIQSVRRALNEGCTNMRMIRYNASLLHKVFAEGEIDNLIIHHPDPWPKKRHWKHRLIQKDFLEKAYKLQRPGSYLEFKTDSAEYFDWAMEYFENSPYRVDQVSYDYHNSELGQASYRTYFEDLFAKQGIRINYTKIWRDG